MPLPPLSRPGTDVRPCPCYESMKFLIVHACRKWGSPLPCPSPAKGRVTLVPEPPSTSGAKCMFSAYLSCVLRSQPAAGFPSNVIHPPPPAPLQMKTKRKHPQTTSAIGSSASTYYTLLQIKWKLMLFMAQKFWKTKYLLIYFEVKIIPHALAKVEIVNK